MSNSSNVFQVTLVRVPGTTNFVNLTEPTTVAEAVAAGDSNPGNWKYMVGGQEVSGDTMVNEHTGTIRLIKSKVKGNS